MRIGVIGAGVMGTGIAQCFAQHPEYSVVLCSSCASSAARAKAKLATSLLGRVAKGNMTQERADDILSNVKTGDITEVAGCNLIIECIPEDIDKKRALFLRLLDICDADCIFATNTSSLSITEMAAGIPNPVVGMHFFNPAPIMKLVEIIPGLNTPAETVDTVISIVNNLGKVAVPVKENSGFVVNRILIPMINEAIELYANQTATAEGIDSAMKLGANHPMGPLELGDFIGLDVCLVIMEAIYCETKNSKYRPHPLLRKMVSDGWLGRKTNRGFYDYESEVCAK